MKKLEKENLNHISGGSKKDVAMFLGVAFCTASVITGPLGLIAFGPACGGLLYGVFNMD